ncbi:hypothetical protein QYF36_021690 [Acer negundo]|nr:hypothetical protein QYF36_021690 [Acer negundo]
MALALITTVRKLRPYFQAYQIEVYMNYPLKVILKKPEVSGRLTKWAIELSEFDIKYLPRTAIKVKCALRFDFKANNNQAKYEAMIAGLRVCTALGADEIEIFSDS